MVRGFSRRVVVVKPQESCFFEQAIFILKDDPTFGSGLKADDILKEACSTAERYMKKGGKKRRLRLNPALSIAVGAGATCVLWFLSSFIKF
ncbi:MAG: lytic transglycosylase domain-containing protein [Clostridiales bacterium]|nr:lytic transglycosylase domain-containing protein [Clostridiales bacterium]